MKDGLESSGKVAKRVFRKYFPLIFVLWILFALYPNPGSLIISIHRLLNFGADPGAVEFMLSELPSDPAAIEKAVLAKIRYRYDWEVYGMPWYCPTVEQVLQKGEGDCNGRALVFASILEAENISYQVRISPVHIWVDYVGKNQTSMENPQVEYLKYDPETGEKQFQIPKIAASEVTNAFLQSFWYPMPDERKALLILGPVGLIVARVILRKKKIIRLTGN